VAAKSRGSTLRQVFKRLVDPSAKQLVVVFREGLHAEERGMPAGAEWIQSIMRAVMARDIDVTFSYIKELNEIRLLLQKIRANVLHVSENFTVWLDLGLAVVSQYD
jgi:hypothetical protein